MPSRKIFSGFTLIEVLIGTAIFVIFAVGIYSGISLVFKIVYQSRLNIVETAALSEELDVVRNLPYADIGIAGGVPAGVLPASKQVVRNGTAFTITTVVRNIDHPFDGTIGGTPNDTAPADYKLVELSMICTACEQKKPVAISTVIGPKHLEGSTNNGALFIHVFDAAGVAVSGANVHIVNTATAPATVIDDTTDTGGYLRIIDAPTGTLSYNITVSKAGYSSDYTVSSSVGNPNPVRPPANVITQTVTNVSFAIDRTGAFNFATVNSACLSIPNVPLTLRGNNLIGTDPTVYKYSQTPATNGGGALSLPNMEWDTYYLGLGVGSGYDIAGTAPQFPFKLGPAVTQDVTVVLRSHTANSLLISVRDAGTSLPLSDAAVRLTANGYDQTKNTGLGYVRQTDWSGGSGQGGFTDQDRYWSDDGGVGVNTPAGDVKLKKIGNAYVGSGTLESSTFDLGQAVDFKNIVIEPTSQPPAAGAESLRFQIATSNISDPASWNFLGPDGATTTFYSAVSTTIAGVHDGERYVRYRAYLTTADTSATPQLSEIAFTYTNSCTPPGQAFFNSLSADTYNLSITRNGYAPVNSTFDVNGNNETIINMSPP